MFTVFVLDSRLVSLHSFNLNRSFCLSCKSYINMQCFESISFIVLVLYLYYFSKKMILVYIYIYICIYINLVISSFCMVLLVT